MHSTWLPTISYIEWLDFDNEMVGSAAENQTVTAIPLATHFAGNCRLMSSFSQT
jgi:hypothetical protein